MGRNLKCIKYKNLLIEMVKHGETQSDIANLLGIARTTVNFRISGKSEWTINEIEKICEHYQKDYYELFKRD